MEMLSLKLKMIIVIIIITCASDERVYASTKLSIERAFFSMVR